MEQLIYGSADQIVGRPVGGWGVLHSTGSLTPETAQRLLGLVSVSLPVRMPQFPSAAELAGREPRFRAEADQAAGFLARSVEAGKDHTGRPGNVVTHAARVRLAPEARLADWFFADGWVAPFGPQQIAQALPPERLAEPPGWAAAASWLREDPARLARLRGIADAAVGELLSGRSLLLRAASVAELARWAAVLTRLLDFASAARVGLRLGEDPHSLAEAVRAGGIVGICFEPEPGTAFLDLTGEPDGVAPDHPMVDLAFAPDDVADAVFARRDALVREAPELAKQQRAALQAAWLLTPGAQVLARDEPIRELLAGFGADRPTALDALAAELGEPAPVREVGGPDIYALTASLPDEPARPDDGVREAIVAANRLGLQNVEVGWLLDHGTLLTGIDRYPADQQAALRAIAAALNIDGEDG